VFTPFHKPPYPYPYGRSVDETTTIFLYSIELYKPDFDQNLCACLEEKGVAF
jgi:hypothetical protein